MIPNCHRHGFDQAQDECRECGLSFCANCLVYVNGETARPFCIQCALAKAGVRSASQRHGRRLRRAEAKRAARSN